MEPINLAELPVWKQVRLEKKLISFDLEIAARFIKKIDNCSNKC
jgi:hypothetical protein